MLSLFATAPALLIGGHGFAGVRCLAPRMDLALTPKLIELGCDEALWSEVRNKQALIDMEDNEGQCRKRIEFLKGAVAGGDDASSRPARPARPDGPYELRGEAPEGVDPVGRSSRSCSAADGGRGEAPSPRVESAISQLSPILPAARRQTTTI